MEREFLREPHFNKKNILTNVLSPHHFDGQQANEDITRLVKEEKSRTLSRRFLIGGVAGTGFSVLNLLRMGQLSPSGRSAALFGTAFFSFFTYAAAVRGGYICVPKSKVAQEGDQASQQ